jgi:alkylhydroperoxidase family enzyme
MTAIEMPLVERSARLQTMRAAVRYNDVHRWARTFLNRLRSSSAIRAEDLVLRPQGADLTPGRDLGTELVGTIPS